MRKSLLITVFIIFIACVSANAQSGTGMIQGFVHCGEPGENYCSERPQITLRPIRNNAKTKADIVLETYKNLEFSQEVFFGEYLVIVTLNFYETYKASVYVPSSQNIKLGIPLHKKKGKQ